MAPKRRWLYAVYFFLGAYTLIAQAILLREFFIIVNGNEFVFGISLGNWLIGVFLGSLLGGLWARKTSQPALIFSLCLQPLGLLPPLMLAAIRLLPLLGGAPAGTAMPLLRVMLYSAVVTVPYSFCIGLAFPLAAALQERGGETGGLGISHIYAVEALGSLAGGLLHAFVLVGRLDPLSTALLGSLPLLLLSAILLGQQRRPRLRLVAFGVLLPVVLLLFSPLAGRLEHLLTLQRWRGISSFPLILCRDSRYQNIQLGEASGQFNAFLNGQLAAVFPNDDDNRLLAAHLYCQHTGPRRILIIGEALSGLARFLLDFPLEKLVVVEIDPLYLQVIRNHLPPADRQAAADPRLLLLNQDGRRFVQERVRKNERAESAESFDLVFLQTAEPSTLLHNRLFTREFFGATARILNPGGVLALRISASENYAGGLVGRYNASVYQTLQSVFPFIAVSPGPSQFLFASLQPGVVSLSGTVLAERFHRAGGRPQWLADIFPSGLYPPEKTRFIAAALQGYPGPLLNTDDRPLTYLYYNEILGWYGGSNLEPLLHQAERIHLPRLFALLGLLVCGRWLFSRIRRRQRPSRMPVLLAAACGGFAGLCLEMLLLYEFQVRFGYVYHHIGLLIALFMAGLAVGAQALRSRLRRWPRQALVLALLLITAFSLLLPLLTRWAGSHPGLIFAWMLASGGLVGATFTVAVESLSASGMGSATAAGLVNGLDYLGGALGAFLSGTLLLPFLGVQGTSQAVAALALAATLLLVSDLSSRSGSHPGAGGEPWSSR